MQEAHGTQANLALLLVTHWDVASYGGHGAEEASSIWGGVVVAIRKMLLDRTLHRAVVEVVRGRVLQVDLGFLSGDLRVVCVHIDPSLSLVGLRSVFSLI